MRVADGAGGGEGANAWAGQDTGTDPPDKRELPMRVLPGSTRQPIAAYSGAGRATPNSMDNQTRCNHPTTRRTSGESNRGSNSMPAARLPASDRVG